MTVKAEIHLLGKKIRDGKTLGFGTQFSTASDKYLGPPYYETSPALRRWQIEDDTVMFDEHDSRGRHNSKILEKQQINVSTNKEFVTIPTKIPGVTRVLVWEETKKQEKTSSIA